MSDSKCSAIGTRGFTLVELAIVLAIAAILAALAMPNFQQLIEGQRARSASADLLLDLARTRSEALKRGINFTLLPVGGNWANGWQISDPVNGALIEDHGAVRNLTITGPASVVFQSSGRVQGAGAVSFNISGSFSSSARCVSLDLGGRPSIKVSPC